MRDRGSPEAGFTLLEVLVALAIVALALGALIKTGAQGTAAVSALRERTLAAWVAENRLTEALLLADWPDTGSDQGVTDMAGIAWRWRLTVSPTADADLRRLEVTVSTEAEASRTVAQLVAFRGRPR